VLCGRLSGGLTSIAIIGSIKIATGIATGRFKTGRDWEGQYRRVIAANLNKISASGTVKD
jgi:hypothetical protein